jgi:hypothetical protein
MPRYSRHRSSVHTCLFRGETRIHNKDTAKIAKKARRDGVLNGGASALEGRNAGPRGPQTRHQKAGTAGPKWFAPGPVYLDQAVCAARKGGCAVVVWLAVRAREGSANGAPATAGWIAEATGLSDRTVRKAVSALVGTGLLRRDGLGVSSS